MVTQPGFALVQYEIKPEDESQPNGPDNTLQQTKLIDTDDGERFIAEVEVYFGTYPFYAVHWATDLLENDLVGLVEKCLSSYANSYPIGVPNILGRISDLTVEHPEKAFANGIVVHGVSDEDKTVGRIELDLIRPLSWEYIVNRSPGLSVTFARINTPLGDFCIYTKMTDRKEMGVMCILKAVDPLAKLISESSSAQVTYMQAKELIEKALESF